MGNVVNLCFVVSLHTVATLTASSHFFLYSCSFTILCDESYTCGGFGIVGISSNLAKSMGTSDECGR